MTDPRFERFFTGKARDFLIRAIDLALDEDGPDLTSMAVFSPTDRLTASIVAKEEAIVVAGLPIARLVEAQRRRASQQARHHCVTDQRQRDICA